MPNESTFFSIRKQPKAAGTAERQGPTKYYTIPYDHAVLANNIVTTVLNCVHSQHSVRTVRRDLVLWHMGRALKGSTYSLEQSTVEARKNWSQGLQRAAAVLDARAVFQNANEEIAALVDVLLMPATPVEDYGLHLYNLMMGTTGPLNGWVGQPSGPGGDQGEDGDTALIDRGAYAGLIGRFITPEGTVGTDTMMPSTRFRIADDMMPRITTELRPWLLPNPHSLAGINWGYQSWRLSEPALDFVNLPIVLAIGAQKANDRGYGQYGAAALVLVQLEAPVWMHGQALPIWWARTHMALMKKFRDAAVALDSNIAPVADLFLEQRAKVAAMPLATLFATSTPQVSVTADGLYGDAVPAILVPLAEPGAGVKRRVSHHGFGPIASAPDVTAEAEAGDPGAPVREAAAAAAEVSGGSAFEVVDLEESLVREFIAFLVQTYTLGNSKPVPIFESLANYPKGPEPVLKENASAGEREAGKRFQAEAKELKERLEKPITDQDYLNHIARTAAMFLDWAREHAAQFGFNTASPAGVIHFSYRGADFSVMTETEATDDLLATAMGMRPVLPYRDLRGTGRTSWEDASFNTYWSSSLVTPVAAVASISSQSPFRHFAALRPACTLWGSGSYVPVVIDARMQSRVGQALALANLIGGVQTLYKVSLLSAVEDVYLAESADLFDDLMMDGLPGDYDGWRRYWRLDASKNRSWYPMVVDSLLKPLVAQPLLDAAAKLPEAKTLADGNVFEYTDKRPPLVMWMPREASVGNILQYRVDLTPASRTYAPWGGPDDHLAIQGLDKPKYTSAAGWVRDETDLSPALPVPITAVYFSKVVAEVVKSLDRQDVRTGKPLLDKEQPPPAAEGTV